MNDPLQSLDRTVVVRMTIEYEVKVPLDWDPGQIEFHRNDSTWCASNAVDELQQLRAKREAQKTPPGCLCDCVKFEYVRESKKALQQLEGEP